MTSSDPAGWTTLDDVLREELKDPEFRYWFEQRALVHESALAVRQMRQAAGLTQRELAALIGVSQPMIARLERGSDRRTPNWDTLGRIAAALGRKLQVAFVKVGKATPLLTVDGRAPRARARRVERELAGAGPASSRHGGRRGRPAQVHP
jgi:transcriptional regulator with XRE-family HTH domain